MLHSWRTIFISITECVPLSQYLWCSTVPSLLLLYSPFCPKTPAKYSNRTNNFYEQSPMHHGFCIVPDCSRFSWWILWSVRNTSFYILSGSCLGYLSWFMAAARIVFVAVKELSVPNDMLLSALSNSILFFSNFLDGTAVFDFSIAICKICTF